MEKFRIAIVHNQEIRETIMKLLGWDESKYLEYQFEQGFVYLKDNLGIPQDYIDLFTTDKECLWWPWWKNLWYNIDDTFIKEFNSDDPYMPFEVRMALTQAYEGRHDVNKIMAYPIPAIIEKMNAGLIKLKGTW